MIFSPESVSPDEMSASSEKVTASRDIRAREVVDENYTVVDAPGYVEKCPE